MIRARKPSHDTRPRRPVALCHSSCHAVGVSPPCHVVEGGGTSSVFPPRYLQSYCKYCHLSAHFLYLRTSVLHTMVKIFLRGSTRPDKNDVRMFGHFRSQNRFCGKQYSAHRSISDLKGQVIDPKVRLLLFTQNSAKSVSRAIKRAPS